jgi:hypothetical protein
MALVLCVSKGELRSPQPAISPLRRLHNACGIAFILRQAQDERVFRCVISRVPLRAHAGNPPTLSVATESESGAGSVPVQESTAYAESPSPLDRRPGQALSLWKGDLGLR